MADDPALPAIPVRRTDEVPEDLDLGPVRPFGGVRVDPPWAAAPRNWPDPISMATSRQESVDQRASPRASTTTPSDLCHGVECRGMGSSSAEGPVRGGYVAVPHRIRRAMADAHGRVRANHTRLSGRWDPPARGRPLRSGPAGAMVGLAQNGSTLGRTMVTPRGPEGMGRRRSPISAVLVGPRTATRTRSGRLAGHRLRWTSRMLRSLKKRNSRALRTERSAPAPRRVIGLSSGLPTVVIVLPWRQGIGHARVARYRKRVPLRRTQSGNSRP